MSRGLGSSSQERPCPGPNPGPCPPCWPEEGEWAETVPLGKRIISGLHGKGVGVEPAKGSNILSGKSQKHSSLLLSLFFCLLCFWSLYCFSSTEMHHIHLGQVQLLTIKVPKAQIQAVLLRGQSPGNEPQQSLGRKVKRRRRKRSLKVCRSKRGLSLSIGSNGIELIGG